ncbi:unnamed protein product [Ilex paraguariensis]|uniref:Uncharacterized protein n=1 Tax=Ilex paraguariensis TaxID=185542 RepID=A0ABC8STV9_9AQUA
MINPAIGSGTGVGASVEAGTGAAAATVGTSAGPAAAIVGTSARIAGANTDGMIGLGAGATNVSSRRGQLAMRRNKMNAPTTTQVSHSTGGVQ